MWIVNVEGLHFEQIVPILLNQQYIKNEMIHRNGADVLRDLNELFEYLECGQTCEKFLLGVALAKSLQKINRLLIQGNEFVDDYRIIPITKEQLRTFLKGIECDTDTS